MKNNFSALKHSELFQGISEDEFGSLVKCLGCTFKSYKKGETIHSAGDFVRQIGIVADGRVQVARTDAWGNHNILADICDGGMFAEAVVCGGLGILPASVAAVADSEIMFIDFQRILSVCSSTCVFHTLLIRNMIGVIARKNIALTGKIEHVTQRTTRAKLLSYLSEQSKLHGKTVFDIPFKRQALADYLSVERSAMSAELSRLRMEGLVKYRKSRFELLAPPEEPIS